VKKYIPGRLAMVNGSASVCALVCTFLLQSAAYADRVDDVLSEPAESADQARGLQGEDTGKWLPLAIPLSNPTVGSGLQLGLLYLHPKKGKGADSSNPTSGIGGMYTDTDSKALAVFHDNYFADDRFRLRAVAGQVDMNLKFYGVGDASFDYSTDFNLDGDAAMVQFSARVPATQSWYLGVRYSLIDADVTFDLSTQFPVLPEISGNTHSSNLALLLTYDSRDSNYYPTDGIFFETVASRDSEDWGSDYNFSRKSANYMQYFQIITNHTLAIKTTLSDVGEGAPFYLQSTLNMRGFAAGRYLDNSSVSLHAEWRYKFQPRWGVVAFTEAGKVAGSFGSLDKKEAIHSYGGGIRWQAIQSKDIHLGIDYAISDDDEAVYFRVGEAY
jgi:outer membrane protein assembly factor BamA